MKPSQKCIIGLVCLGLIGCTSRAQSPLTSTAASVVAPMSAPTLDLRATRAPDTPASTPALLPTNEVDDYLASVVPIEHLPLGRVVDLTSLAMFDGFNGWATGFAQGASISQQFEHILRTQDGGKTWVDVTPPWPAPGPETSTFGVKAFFLDTNRAWVAHMPPGIEHIDEDGNMARNELPPLIVWGTSDGGQTWQAASILTPMPEYYIDLSLFHFADERNGWLSIDGVGLSLQDRKVLSEEQALGPWAPTLLLRTTDGGLSWEKVLDFEAQPEVDLHRLRSKVVDFVDSEVGVLTLETDYRRLTSALIWTRDGGFTWERQELPPPEELSSEELVQCTSAQPYLFSPQNLKVLLRCFPDSYMDHIGFLYSSEDGGSSWRITKLPPPDPELIGQVPAYYRHFYLNEKHGWTYVMHPSRSRTDFYHTDDGGVNWRKVGEQDWQEARLAFVTPEIGFAYGVPGFVTRGETPFYEGNQLFRSTDAGTSWEETTSIIGQALGRPGGPALLCPDAPPSRVAQGILTRVTYTDGSSLAIRTEAGLSTGDRIKDLPEGTRMTIRDGPVCADDFAWWQVETADGLTGWVAEGDWEAYFLEPLE